MKRRYPSRGKDAPRGEPLDGRRVFGANLRRVRKLQGLTQEGLADRAGLHWTYVGSVERAERNISIDAMCRLAWALKVDLRDLLVP